MIYSHGKLGFFLIHLHSRLKMRHRFLRHKYRFESCRFTLTPISVPYVWFNDLPSDQPPTITPTFIWIIAKSLLRRRTSWTLSPTLSVLQSFWTARTYARSSRSFPAFHLVCLPCPYNRPKADWLSELQEMVWRISISPSEIVKFVAQPSQVGRPQCSVESATAILLQVCHLSR